MELATWENCQADFVFDGGFIDLQVPNSGAAEWDAFWVALRSSPFELTAYRDDETYSLPDTAAKMLAEREVASVMLSMRSGCVTANCHFFGGDLEFDIDPREVVNEQAFESVLSIMRFVAATAHHPVFATPEGGSVAYAFLRVNPDGQAVYLPKGSVRRN